MSIQLNTIQPRGAQEFDLFDLNEPCRENFAKKSETGDEKESTDRKIKRCCPIYLVAPDQKKIKMTHPLTFLFTSKLGAGVPSISILQSYIDKEGLCLDLVEDCKDEVFISLFKEAFTPYLEAFSLENRIQFFKNLSLISKAHPPLNANSIACLCRLLVPFGLWSEEGAFAKTVGELLKKNSEEWEVIESLYPQLFKEKKDLHWLHRFFVSLEDIHPYRWADFVPFYISYADECSMPTPSFIPLFNILQKDELTRLLQNTTRELRQLLFKEEYFEIEQIGLEILTRMPPESLQKYFFMIQNIDSRYFSYVLYLPQILRLDKEGFDERSYEILTHFIQSGLISFKNFSFTILEGSNLEIFFLENIKVLLCVKDLQKDFGEHHALMEFLKNSLIMENEPITKRILAEDCLRFLFMLLENNKFSTQEERKKALLFWHQTKNFFNLVEFKRKNITQDQKAFKLLALNSGLIDISGNTLLIKDCPTASDYLEILQILAYSQIDRLEHFEVIFLDAQPEMIGGQLQYKIPPYLDMGGPKRTLFQKVAAAILCNKEGLGIDVDFEGFPILEENASAGKTATYKNFGAFMSVARKLQIPLGKIFCEKTYLLIRTVKMSSEHESFFFLQQADRILEGDRLLNKNPLQTHDLEQLKEVYVLDSIEEVPSCVYEDLKKTYANRLRAVKMLMEGFDLLTHYDIRALGPIEFSYEVEGKMLNAENFSRFIEIIAEDFPTKSEDQTDPTSLKIQESITDWLLQSSTEKLKNFTIACTGSTAFCIGDRLKITVRPKAKNDIQPDTNCFLHTCTKEITLFADSIEEIFETLEGIHLEKKFNAV